MNYELKDQRFLESREVYDQLKRKYPKLFRPCESQVVGKLHPAEISMQKGWAGILDRYCEVLTKISDDMDEKLQPPPPEGRQYLPFHYPVIQQVKEKFGTLRIHINGGSINGKVNVLTLAAMREADETCEECGKNNYQNDIGRITNCWIKTICKPCFDQYMAEETLDPDSNWVSLVDLEAKDEKS